MLDPPVGNHCLLPRLAKTNRHPSQVANKSTDESRSSRSGQRPIEANADQLLAARLDTDQASAGWIRLFDGHTLFGWEITGDANWRIEDDSDRCR